jgi:hypothetical protein
MQPDHRREILRRATSSDFGEGALIVVIGGRPVVVASDRPPEADAPLHLFVEPVADHYRVYAVDKATLIDVCGADWRTCPTLLIEVAGSMTIAHARRIDAAFQRPRAGRIAGLPPGRFHGGAWVRLKDYIPWVGWMRSSS